MADLKKWAPSSRIEGDAVKGYMIGKKDGHWVFAPEAEERIAELEAQLAALTWTPISESNLPKVGDEIGHWNPRTGKWEIASCTSDWKEGAIRGNKWAYRRPINPPAPERGANGNR